MKIDIPDSCFECYEEDSNNGLKSKIPKPELFELNYDGIYKQVCPRGHVHYTILGLKLFQTLFDMGFLALLDGYTRESVSSFATSLERFYEFIIKLIYLNQKLEDKRIIQNWKQISKSSERQLGSFISLYSIHYNSQPELPTNNMIKFRNDIIHKGEIPTTQIALNYGQDIYDVIYKNLVAIYKQSGDSIKKIFLDHSSFNTRKLQSKHSDLTEKNVRYSYGPSIINMNDFVYGKLKKINLKDLYTEYKESNKIFRLRYTNRI